MKEYVKPTFEFVELRPEEGLASKGSKPKGNCASGRRKCEKHSHYPKW